jgi:hypothetical protein
LFRKPLKGEAVEMKKSRPVSVLKPTATTTTVYVVVSKKWQKKKVTSVIDMAKRKARSRFNCPGKIYICIVKTPPPPDSLSMRYSELIA